MSVEPRRLSRAVGAFKARRTAPAPAQLRLKTGTTTAEYAVGTVAGAGFAALLLTLHDFWREVFARWLGGILDLLNFHGQRLL